MTDSNTASTAFAASFLESSLLSATALTNSVLFMILTFCQSFKIQRSLFLGRSNNMFITINIIDGKTYTKRLCAKIQHKIAILCVFLYKNFLLHQFIPIKWKKDGQT